MTVTGSPPITIDIGGGDRTATYAGTAGKSMLFSYTVAGGDSDTDGISIDANSVRLNGGAITDAQGNAATLTHSAVAANAAHKVSAPGGL